MFSYSRIFAIFFYCLYSIIDLKVMGATRESFRLNLTVEFLVRLEISLNIGRVTQSVVDMFTATNKPTLFSVRTEL